MEHLVKESNKSLKENTSLKNLGTSAAGLGVAAAGMLVAHNGLKLAGMSNNFLVNLGLVAGSIAGLMYVNHPLAKLAILGLGVYAVVNTISIGVKEVVSPSATTPAAVKGLSGLLPDSVKEKIAKYVPSFGSVDEVSGYAGDGYGGTENLEEHINGAEQLLNTELEGAEELLGTASMAM